MIVNDFMGLSGYVWWQGVVEDRNDPLKLGRCRVRVLGFDSEDKKKIPTDELPWAYPAMPLTAMPGTLPAAMVEGTWVMGFFRDGEHAQDPVITHKIDLGMVTRNNNNLGFNDPEENSSRPINKNKPDKIGTSNVSSIALGDKGKSDVPDAVRKYPYNHVLETESGHVVELNDTPGEESVSVTHKSGSYVIIDKDGNLNSSTKEYNQESTEMKLEVEGNITENAVKRIENVEDHVLTGDMMVVKDLVVMGGLVAQNVVGVTSVTGATVTGIPSAVPDPSVGELTANAAKTVASNSGELLSSGVNSVFNLLDDVSVPIIDAANKFEEDIKSMAEPDYPRLLNLVQENDLGQRISEETWTSIVPNNHTYLTLEYLDKNGDRQRRELMKVIVSGNTVSIDFTIQPTVNGKRLMILGEDDHDHKI